MIFTLEETSIISDMTLALLEDTGFYQVNYYSGELFKFGKNKGCEFFSKKCIENDSETFDEFCHVNGQPKCTHSRTHKGKCFVFEDYSNIPEEFQYFSNPKKGGSSVINFCPFSEVQYFYANYNPDSCKYGKSYLNGEYGQILGDNSFCFLSSLLPSSSELEEKSQAICYEVECDPNKKELIVKVGDEKLTCPKEGGNTTFPGYKGILECPRYIDFSLKIVIKFVMKYSVV